MVYDEIHYLRDKERGVVWEESIVLMPKTVRFAFLSATIPNALEFAQWIAKTHGCSTLPALRFPFQPLNSGSPASGYRSNTPASALQGVCAHGYRTFVVQPTAALICEPQ